MREPVHAFYGGAHLYRTGIARKLGAIALGAMDRARLPGVSAEIEERVRAKLRAEPIEALYIDFEDGYGYRPDNEEDEHARAAARAFAEGDHPPHTGIRIKPWGERARRTLGIFLDIAAPASITLPKASGPEEVRALEQAAPGIPIELLIETPTAMRDPARLATPRCIAAHFGAYDYLSACGIPASEQHLMHPACDLARDRMRLAFAGSAVRLVDGVTNLLPLEAQVDEAWSLHMRHVRHALANGFYAGWDVHPAQLPARYAALYSFFLATAAEAGTRLRNFLDAQAQATRVGAVFDDWATGQALVAFFRRASACGALTGGEIATHTGRTKEELAAIRHVQL